MNGVVNSNQRFSKFANPVQCLLRRMQEICFGSVVFDVKEGLPDMSRPWLIKKTLKIAGGNNGSSPESLKPDFVAGKKQLDLIHQLSQLSDGVQVTVEIQHGLPAVVHIEYDFEAV